MALHPHPAYKPSGIPWLGDVPEHWEVRRVGMLAQILNGATPSTGNASYWDGDIVWITPDDLGKLSGRYVTGSARRITEEGYKACGTNLAPAGSIAISTRAPIGHLGVLRSDACVNQGCRLLVPDDAVKTEYLHYALSTTTSTLASFGQGSTFTELSRTLLAAFQLPLPPLPEQAAIIRYLDYVDRRVRRYVNAKGKLIALLEEEKQAIINLAVTRGLDPNVPLKPSGIEWLGDVPEHWEVRRLKNWVGINEAVLPETTEPDFEFPYLEIGAVGTGLLVSQPTRIRFGSAPSRARRIVRTSDTIVSTVRTYLKATWFAGEVFDELICSTGFVVLTPRNEVCPKFVSYLAQSNAFTDRVTAASVGTAYPAIAESRLGLFHVPLPPLPEQTAIVEYLDTATARIDAAAARARRQIELLQEYRTRLIADVVTCKLDVREAAAHLPDEGDEEEPLDEDGLMLDNMDEGSSDVSQLLEEEQAMESEVTA